MSTWYIPVARHYGFGFQKMLAFHRMEHSFFPGNGANTENRSLPHTLRPTGGCTLLPAADPPPDSEMRTKIDNTTNDDCF